MSQPITSVVDHVRARQDRPWLIAGKGPSAARFADVDPDRYHLFTLNHACRFIPEGDKDSVAHFMDVEAARDCVYVMLARSAPLCLPWYPHVKFKPGKESLATDPAFAGHDPAGLAILSYNSTIAGNLPRNPDLPTIRVRFFSAVAAFNILAAAGCREVFSIGVDGGTGYAPGFDLADKLANGRPSFDAQFAEIRATANRRGIRHVRL